MLADVLQGHLQSYHISLFATFQTEQRKKHSDQSGILVRYNKCVHTYDSYARYTKMYYLQVTMLLPVCNCQARIYTLVLTLISYNVCSISSDL